MPDTPGLTPNQWKFLIKTKSIKDVQSDPDIQRELRAIGRANPGIDVLGGKSIVQLPLQWLAVSFEDVPIMDHPISGLIDLYNELCRKEGESPTRILDEKDSLANIAAASLPVRHQRIQATTDPIFTLDLSQYLGGVADHAKAKTRESSKAETNLEIMAIALTVEYPDQLRGEFSEPYPAGTRWGSPRRTDTRSCEAIRGTPGRKETDEGAERESRR